MLRTYPQEIDTWDEPQRLSIVIERGFFGYKKIIDWRKQYNLWLCWLPRAPTPRSATPEMPTPIPRKKSVRKEASVKQEVKQEVKEELEEPSLASLLSLYPRRP